MYKEIKVQTVLIEITNVCNMACRHCFNSFDRDANQVDRFMSLTQIKYIIDRCQNYNLDKIYLSGGEPLCHPRILQIIQMCGTYPKMFFTITTNGLLLSSKIISEIEKYKNICIQVSVDGISKNIYEAQRGNGTYDLFRKNLDTLIASRIQYLTARTCVTRLNYQEVGPIYEYLINHIIFPSFLFVNQLGNAAQNWNMLSLSLANRLKVLNDIIVLNEKYSQTVSLPEPVSTCNFTEKIEIKSLLIKFDGSIAPCQFFYTHNIGNIFETEIADILNYDNLKKYYEVAELRKKKLERSEKCLHCRIQKICSYGCVGLSQICGDTMGFDGQCDYRVILTSMYSSGIIPLPHPPQGETGLTDA